MTATEELRRLLDERGIEWTHEDGTVNFANDGHWCHAWAYSDGEMCVSMGYFTPAQAVDATLGRGTCRVVSKPSDMWECECGKAWWHGGEPNFCPNCGREVVFE